MFSLIYTYPPTHKHIYRYGSGAFYSRLNYSEIASLDSDLVNLVNDGFIDEKTRALIFTNRFLSVSDGLLATQVLVFEFDIAGTVIPTYIFSVQALKDGDEWSKVTTYFWIVASINIITIFLFILDSTTTAKLINRERLGMGKAYHKRTALNIVLRDGFMALQIALSITLLVGCILKIVVLVETPTVSMVSSDFLTVTDNTEWATDYFHLSQVYSAALFMDTMGLLMAMGVLMDKLRIFRSFWIFVRSVELSSRSFFMIMTFVMFATTVIALIAVNAFGEGSGGVVFSSYVLCVCVCVLECHIFLFSLRLTHFLSTTPISTHQPIHHRYSKALMYMLTVLMGQGSDGFLITNVIFAVAVLFPLFWMIGSIFFAIHLDSYFEATENYKQLLKSKRYIRKQILMVGDAYAEFRRIWGQKEVGFNDIRLEMLRVFEDDEEKIRDEDDGYVNDDDDDDTQADLDEDNINDEDGDGIRMTKMGASSSSSSSSSTTSKKI